MRLNLIRCGAYGILLVWLLAGAQLHGEMNAQGSMQPVFEFEKTVPLPLDLDGFAIGRDGDTLLAAGGVNKSGIAQRSVFRYNNEIPDWEMIGELPVPWANGGSASTGSGLILVGGFQQENGNQTVVEIKITEDSLVTSRLADLPFPVENPAAGVGGNALYLAGVKSSTGMEPVFLRLPVASSLSFLQNLLSRIGFTFERGDSSWEVLPSWPGDVLRGSSLCYSFESLHLFGYEPSSGKAAGYAYKPGSGWRVLTPPPDWSKSATAITLGEAHIFAFDNPAQTVDPAPPPPVRIYHTLTDTWTDAAKWQNPAETPVSGISDGDSIYLVSSEYGQHISVLPPSNNYGWIDHLVVIIYLLGMVAMGAWFIRREKNTKDYFRAGSKVPWWAIGMSLFATGASAISLMTMPGKSYSGNWTFFTISLYAAMCMPISLFLLAPLIRKLDISTPNEYLELRFGLTARMMGSVIYVVNQVLGRMAPIIFLPSIAMSAITGIDIWIWILVIGCVTTLYTFMGGLSAVIWTDTIQGFIMVSTVAGCLFLILTRIDMPLDQIWSTLQDNGKLHMFDWGWDVTQPTVIMILTGNIFITLMGVGDQNYVQRIQAAPSLRDAKKAITTQMAVSIPINVILFGLGTALYLYYRANPVELNPLMKTDGIYPLFAAQHLPVGVSGLVIAALLAASMSTISSAICSVANLGIEDFYRRFKQAAVAEERVLFYARVLSILVGILGIVGAIFLSRANSKSVWDAALIVTGLITNGIVGFFGLGLLTRRTHELGALLGLAAGMLVTIYLDAFTPVTFWLYAAFGSIVTFSVGYVLSLAIPLQPKPLEGLTIYTLDQPRRRL